MAVDDDQLRAIIDMDDDRDTAPFITVAQLIVDEDLAGKGLSSDRLDQIALYLAGHFTCITEERGGLERSRLGDGEDAYKQIASLMAGFASTRYGQQAMILDTSGTLAELSTNASKLKARFSVIPVSNYHFGVATQDAGTIDPFNE